MIYDLSFHLKSSDWRKRAWSTLAERRVLLFFFRIFFRGFFTSWEKKFWRRPSLLMVVAFFSFNLFILFLGDDHLSWWSSPFIFQFFQYVVHGDDHLSWWSSLFFISTYFLYTLETFKGDFVPYSLCIHPPIKWLMRVVVTSSSKSSFVY